MWELVAYIIGGYLLFVVVLGFIGFLFNYTLAGLSKLLGIEDKTEIPGSEIHSDGPFDTTDHSFEEKYEREQRINTVRQERSYLSDDEIIDRHSSSWGDSQAREVVKESKEPSSFIGWLLK